MAVAIVTPLKIVKKLTAGCTHEMAGSLRNCSDTTFKLFARA